MSYSRADKTLDEMEHNPAPMQQAVFDFSRGPVGTAATQGVEVAAKLTVKVCTWVDLST